MSSNSPAAGTLHHHEQFHSAYLSGDRDVVVWLPPGYQDDRSTRSFLTDVPNEGSSRSFDSDPRPEPPSGTIALNDREERPSGTPVRNDREERPSGTPVPNRYPVLYMHDGQNLFDPATAFQTGNHWRIGETASALIAGGRVEPLIVVGIYNTGTARIHEYTPTKDARLGGGQADDYGRLIVEELKPFIDATYRTRPEATHTGIGGSSLGGLVTLHLGFTYPRTFSRLAVLSPSVWWDRRAILRTVRQASRKPPLRIWVDMGTAEGRRGLDDARLLKAALVGAGFVEGEDLHYAEYEGADHSEGAWAARIGPVLQWLFPA